MDPGARVAIHSIVCLNAVTNQPLRLCGRARRGLIAGLLVALASARSLWAISAASTASCRPALGVAHWCRSGRRALGLRLAGAFYIRVVLIEGCGHQRGEARYLDRFPPWPSRCSPLARAAVRRRNSAAIASAAGGVFTERGCVSARMMHPPQSDLAPQLLLLGGGACVPDPPRCRVRVGPLLRRVRAVNRPMRSAVPSPCSGSPPGFERWSYARRRPWPRTSQRCTCRRRHWPGPCAVLRGMAVKQPALMKSRRAARRTTVL